jgi:hypothetical protein
MSDAAHATTSTNPLDLLLDRARILAERVEGGSIGFIEAVDCAYSAAVWSGLVDRYGDDAIQQVLATAFMGVRRDSTA